MSDRDQKIDSLKKDISETLKPEITRLEEELAGMIDIRDALKKEIEEMAKDV